MNKTKLILFFILLLAAGLFIVKNKHSLPPKPVSLFTNIQAKSGINFHHEGVSKIPGIAPEFYSHGSGVAAADIDNDGLTDVYFVNEGGSSRLYKNLGGGKFQDITQSSHTGTDGVVAIAAAFGDYDNDGYNDLAVSTIRKGILLFHNNGDGTFTNVSDKLGVNDFGHPATLVWLDIKHNGKLDLIAVNVGPFTDPSEANLKKYGYYIDVPNAHENMLKIPPEQPIVWTNNGDGTFTNVGNYGLQINDWTGSATTVDLNKDNYPDIYITSLAGPDHFYLNEQGNGFKEVTNDYFPKTSWGSFEAKFFDFDNSGK